MSELLCRPAQVLEWHGSLTVLPKPSHCHVSNPICVSTVMWVRKERLPPGHLNYAPGDPRSLPVSSHCTGSWGGWPLSFPSELDPSVPYCPLLPTAWSEGGEAFWQGWLTELSSQGTCQPPGLPDGVLRAALGCGSCSGPWVQLRRCFTRCEVLLLSLIPRWRAVTTAGPRCHRPWDPSSSSWEQQPMGSDKLKPSFIKISSKIGCATAWCSSCASVLSAFPDRRMWQMQNSSSVKIFVKLTHFKYLEETISSVKALC